jgi:hypothetical protein
MKGIALAIIVMLAVLACVTNGFAWDVTYDGSVLPNSASLGSTVWLEDSNNYLGGSHVQNGVLHLVDNNVVHTAGFYREGSMNLPAGKDVAIETRVKVTSSSSSYGSDYSGVGVGFSTLSGGAWLELWSDRMAINFGGSNYRTFAYLDMTQFHVIKLEMQGSARNVTICVDGLQVLSGGAAGGTNTGGIQFGAISDPGATSDSYWDYVSYSVVPEPSSILAFAGGIAGLGGLALRRRRSRTSMPGR